MSLSREQPPFSTDKPLAEFLQRRFDDIQQSFSQPAKFPERKEMPYKPQFGDFQYFGDPAIHNYDASIVIRGWYGFSEILPATDPKTGVWVLLIQEPVATYMYVSAGYGGISLSTPTGISDLGAGWQTLPANQVVISAPRGVVQDFANDALEVTTDGVWLLNVVVTLSHDEFASGGREFTLQLWNDTDNAMIGETLIGVGRAQGLTNWSGSLMMEIPASALAGDSLVVRVGNGDTITGVTLENFQYSLNHVSNAIGVPSV